jgi:hypothetical protein
MPAMKSRAQLPLFFVSAILALALHFFAFEMRYIWYLPKDAFLLWRTTYIICMGAIVALWLFFPSRVLVAVVCFFSLFFPHLYPAGLAAQRGRVFDLQTVLFSLVIVGIFVAVTVLRRRIKLRNP